MFNITVLKLKDIIKYVVGLFLLILFLIIVFNILNKDKIKNNAENKIVNTVEKGIQGLSSNNFLTCLNQSIPVIANINEKNESDTASIENSEMMETILSTQISSIKTIEKLEEANSKQQENVQDNSKANNTQVEQTTNQEISTDNSNDDVPTGVPTQVITNNPITESFNVQYGNVKIKNQTDYELTQEMLTPDITIENKNIILFHTHSCESYTSSEAYPYTPTGNFRTTDLNFTVTRVGTELENCLKKYNYNVIHSTDYHDYPSYNGSYTKSLATVENLLQTTPSDIIIDLHRDAIGSRSDYAPIVKIGDNDIAAQLMFVIGTNAGGLWHPNWNQNLKFAIKIQEKAEEMYPGLFKPIMLTTSRYNQHTGKFASIIEVGATGNTLEQCLTSMKYLAKVMNEVVK